VTAGPSPYVRSDRHRPSGFALLLRRLVIGAAGLLVAAVAAAACVLSFDDLRALARQAGAREHLAHLYPAAFDALLLIALISFLALGAARPIVRLQAGFVLLVLLAAASWANVAMAMRFTIDARLGAVIVGVVPWVMLLVALWLLTLLVKHAQVRRAAADDAPDAGPYDIVPFTETDAAEEERRPDAAAPDGVPTAPPPAVAGPPGRTAAEAGPDDAERPDPGDAAADRPAAPATGSPAPVGVSHEPPIPDSAALPAPLPAGPAAPSSDSSGGPASGGPAADPRSPGAEGPQAAPEAPRPVPDAGDAVADSADTRPVGPAKEKGRRRLWRRRSAGAATEDAPADVRPGAGEVADRESADEAGPRDVAAAGDAAETPTARLRGNRPVRWGDLVRRPADDGTARPGAERDARAPAAAVDAPGAEAADEPKDDPKDTVVSPRDRDAAAGEAVTEETGTRVWPPATSPAQASTGESADEPGADPDAAEPSEAEKDTRPYPHVRKRHQPLPRGTADADPGTGGSLTGPTVPLAPPSGRMRSSPTPPQD